MEQTLSASLKFSDSSAAKWIKMCSASRNNTLHHPVVKIVWIFMNILFHLIVYHSTCPSNYICLHLQIQHHLSNFAKSSGLRGDMESHCLHLNWFWTHSQCVWMANFWTLPAHVMKYRHRCVCARSSKSLRRAPRPAEWNQYARVGFWNVPRQTRLIPILTVEKTNEQHGPSQITLNTISCHKVPLLPKFCGMTHAPPSAAGKTRLGLQSPHI